MSAISCPRTGNPRRRYRSVTISDSPTDKNNDSRHQAVTSIGFRRPVFNDVEFVFAQLDCLHAKYDLSALIEGDARGVDRIAGAWAQSRNVSLIKFPADWKHEGRHAALIRNERMLRDGRPDLVIAFPGGNGTFHTCRLADELGISVIRFGQGS